MNGVDYETDEEEVLNGVSMLHQELQIERSLNDGLAQQFEELKVQHNSDNEVTTELRKRIVKLENDLIEGLTKSNAKRSGEEALMTRLRTLLEKSEASRHQSEYALLLEQKKYRDLNEELADKEAQNQEEIQKYKNLLKDYQKRAKEWEKAVELAEKAANMERENLESSFGKLKKLIADKDNVIEFLNFEINEKRNQGDELSRALAIEQKNHTKTKENLETCETVILKQKETSKQQSLRQAVYEQKEKKLKHELKTLGEEGQELESQLQRERGLNIQSSQQFSRIQEEMIQLERNNSKLHERHNEDEKQNVKLSEEIVKLTTQFQNLEQDNAELIAKFTLQTETNSKTEKELNKELKDREEQITKLLGEIKQHQTVCDDMANELGSLQKSMGQVESQYGKSIAGLERLYCQNFDSSSSTITPVQMVKSISVKLHELNNKVLQQEVEVEELRRAVERNESLSEVQKRSLASKSETIQSLQDQITELTSQLSELHQSNSTLSHTNKALQQQITDITSLLATEQEKTLTLLKDKKEVIRQKHDILKEQCEAVRQIGWCLGETSTESDWSEICRSSLAAAQRHVAEKNELNLLLKEAQEEVKSCHSTMENLSKKVDSVRVECSKKLTESESTHSGHTKTLEDNYVQLVDTLNTKLQASEGNLIKTNEKIRSFYQENHSLKEHISSLEEDLLTCEQRRVSFQAAVGMLGSTVLHHMNSQHRLLHVQAILQHQLRKESQMTAELQTLSRALADSDHHKPSPICRFRKGVIAVLAANRLKVFGKTFKENYMLGVPAGENPITWLESEGLDKLVSGAIRHWRSKPLSHTTDKLVSAIFNNTDTLLVEMYSDSLLHKVARGNKSYTLPNPVASVKTFVLNLTQRLHSVEVERRSLIAKVSHWQKEANELKGAVEQTSILSRKVKQLENMAFETVPISKHEGTLKELASVMGREECLREEAHNLRQQLKKLDECYEDVTTQLQERSETLDEAIKDLSHQKLTQRQTEQSSRQNSRRTATLEKDNKNLHEQLCSVQKTAEQRSREQEVLMGYLSKLQVALQERKIRVTSGNLSSTTGYLSMNSDPTHGVAEVQKICSLYEDILKLTHRRISGLERDVRSFQTHTDSLKDELSAACHRLLIEDIPTGKPLVGDHQDVGDRQLVPLVPRAASVKELGARVGQNFADVMDSALSWS